MGLFISIVNHTFGWLIHKKEVPMDRVVEWLRENDMSEYIQKFEEHGWDKLSLLLEMTENDIEMCIKKPGHKAKFQRALRSLKSELNPSVASQTDIHEEFYRKPIKTGTKENTLISAVNGLYETKADADQHITETNPHNGVDSNTSNNENVQSDSEYYHETFCSGKVVLTTDVEITSKPISTLSTDLSTENKADTEQPLVASDLVASDCIENKISGVIIDESNGDNKDRVEFEPYAREHAKSEKKMAYKEIADTKTLFDANIPATSQGVDRSQQIVVVSCDDTSESPLVQAAVTGSLVHLTIATIKHSEYTSVGGHTLEKNGPECEQMQHPLNNLHDQMSTIASSFEKKDDMYVETKAYRELKTIVEDQNWATLLGKAGDGKSATAAHLMLHYKPQGYLPIFLSSIHQWQMLISSKPSIKQFVMIDDMFGSIYIENRKAEGWLSLMKDMEKIVKERNGDLLVVCTSRRHIFTDVKSKLYNCSLFTRTSIVDMTNEDYQLSDQEKLDVFHKFTTRYNIKVEEKLFKSVSAVNPPHGFPHCAEMFCTNAFMRERSLDFFKNPKETVQKELHNFKDNDPVKFLVLLLVLYKKHIHLSFFGEIIEHGDEQVVQLFKLLGIQQSMAYASMIQAVNALTNTYLTKTADGYYSFSHESLKENVSEVFISLNPSHAIKVLEFEQILTHVNKSRVEVKSSSHCGLTQRGIGATTSKMVAEWKACDSK